MVKNGEKIQRGHLYQKGHNPFRSFYAGIETDSAYTQYKGIRILLILILSNSAYTQYKLKSIQLTLSIS
jgi:hypothetical protein